MSLGFAAASAGYQGKERNLQAGYQGVVAVSLHQGSSGQATLVWPELEVSSVEVVHVCWLVCCELELDESLLAACLPMAVHVLKLHWWQVWLPWLELRVSSVGVVHVCWLVCLSGLEFQDTLVAACLPMAVPCTKAALVAGVVVVAGAGGVICGGCPCVLADVLEWAGVPGYIGGCMFAGACPCPLAAALVAGVVVVAGAGGVICGGCPCVLAGVL